MLAQFRAACDRAPAGMVKARKWDDQLKAAANARLSDEPDPETIWREVCEYLPTDDHYNGKDMATRELRWQSWKCKLEFVVSPSGWRKITEKVEDARTAPKMNCSEAQPVLQPGEMSVEDYYLRYPLSKAEPLTPEEEQAQTERRIHFADKIREKMEAML